MKFTKIDALYLMNYYFISNNTFTFGKLKIIDTYH